MHRIVRPIFVLVFFFLSFAPLHSAFASEAALLALFEQLEKRGIVVSHSNLQGVGENATFDELRLSSGKEGAAQFVLSSGTVTKATASDGVGLNGDTFAAKELRIESGGEALTFVNFQIQDFAFPHMELLLDGPVETDPAIKQADPLGVLNGTFYKFLAGTKFSLFSVDSAKTNVFVNDAKGVIATGPLALESMQDGKLASYAINSIDFSMAGERKGEASFSIEKILVTDYNIATLSHVFDIENYKDGKGDGIWRDAAGVGTVSNIEFEADGGFFKIAKITSGASRLRQLDIPPIEAMKVIQGVANAQQSGENPIKVFRELAPIMSSFYRMAEFDELRIEGLDVSPPKGATPFKLGIILVERYSVDQGLKEVSIADLSFADPKEGVSVNLGRFALGDIQFPALVDIMTYLESISDDNPPKPSYAAVASLSPTLGQIDIKSFSGVFGRDGIVNFDGVTLTATDYIRLIPTKLSLKLDNVIAPLEGLDRSNDVAEILVKMGYKQAVLNGTIDMVWTEATQELAILPSQIRINDMGVLNISGTVGNVPRQFIEDPEKGAAFAAGMTFKEAQISFEDQSLTNRFVEMTAKSSGGDVAAVRQQFGALAKGPLAILQKPDFASKVGTIVDNFLANPGTVTVTAKPAQPLPLVGFAIMAQQAPGNFVDALNIQVSGP